VQWLDGVLTDLAGGQRVALSASPLQRVAAQVTRAANAPGRAALDDVGSTVTHTVDRAVGTVTQAGAAVEEYAGRAARLGTDAAGTAVAAGQDALSAGRDAAVQVAGTAVAAGQDALTAGRDAAGSVVAAGQGAVVAGRDAAVQAAERLTRRTPDTDVDTPTQSRAAEATGAGAPAATAPDTTAPDTTAPDTGTAPTGPPIPGFAELSAQAAIAALRTLDDPADLAAVLAFEQAHGNRRGVLAAARVRADAVRGD
jgi:hypothetical protein